MQRELVPELAGLDPDQPEPRALGDQRVIRHPSVGHQVARADLFRFDERAGRIVVAGLAAGFRDGGAD
jgi:hypothetical protein